MEEDQLGAEKIKKMKIQFYKTALNAFRARKLSLAAFEAQMTNVSVPEDMCNFETLCSSNEALHSGIAQLQSMKESIELIHSCITWAQVADIRQPDIKREFVDLLNGVSYLSKALMDNYKKLSDLEGLEVLGKRNYLASITNFKYELKAINEETHNSSKSAEERRKLQKAKNQVDRINIIRALKSILIGNFASNHINLPELNEMRTSCRRTLTIDDFSDAWDVGRPT